MITQSIVSAAICGHASRFDSGKVFGLALGLCVALGVSAPASAAVVTYTLTTDPPGLDSFSIFGGIPGPTGTVTLDNGAVVAVDINVNAVTYGTYSFSSLPGVQLANPQPGCVFSSCIPTYVDFGLDVLGANTVEETFSYGVDPSAPNTGGIINWSGDGVLTPSVPEPSSWLLSIVGIGLLGAVLRRRCLRPSLREPVPHFE